MPTVAVEIFQISFESWADSPGLDCSSCTVEEPSRELFGFLCCGKPHYHLSLGTFAAVEKPGGVNHPGHDRPVK